MLYNSNEFGRVRGLGDGRRRSMVSYGQRGLPLGSAAAIC